MSIALQFGEQLVHGADHGNEQGWRRHVREIVARGTPDLSRVSSAR